MFTDIIVLTSQHSRDENKNYYHCQVVINASSFDDAFKKAGLKLKEEAHKSVGVIYAEIWALKHCSLVQGVSYWQEVASFEYNVDDIDEDELKGCVFRRIDRQAMLQHTREREEEAQLSYKQFERCDNMGSSQNFTDDGDELTAMWGELPPEIRNQLSEQPEKSEHTASEGTLQDLPPNVQEIVDKWEKMSQESRDMVEWLANHLVDGSKPPEMTNTQ